MNIFNNERRLRRQVNLKNVKGERIREQYFNVFIFLLIFGVFIPCIILFTISAITDGSGTKFNETSDMLDAVFMILKILIFPVVLSVLNRYVFGEIICVLDNVGINYSGGFIRWDSITDIVYVIDFPDKVSFGCCYARVIGKDINIKIYSVPAFLLLRAKKYNENIKVRYSKWSIAMLVTYAVVPSIIIAIIFLKNL